MNTKNLLTLPNILSISRIFLMPIFIYSIITSHNYTALIILLIVAITDALDGYFARKKSMTTKFGAVLDGICDKIFVIPSGIALFIVFNLQIWKIALIFARDIFVIISFFIIIIAIPSKKVMLESAFFGKLVTVLQYTAIAIIILDLRFQTEIIILIAIISIIAVIQYIFFHKK